MDEIRTLCKKFRQAIVDCPKSLLPISFKLFPLGACGDASLALAKFLQNNGYEGFYYVLAWKGSQSHAWLEKNGWIFDITADQFGEHLSEVIVTDKSDFHRDFIEDRRNKADISRYDSCTQAEITYACDRITQYLVE